MCKMYGKLPTTLLNAQHTGYVPVSLIASMAVTEIEDKWPLPVRK